MSIDKDLLNKWDAVDSSFYSAELDLIKKINIQKKVLTSNVNSFPPIKQTYNPLLYWADSWSWDSGLAHLQDKTLICSVLKNGLRADVIDWNSSYDFISYYPDISKSKNWIHRILKTDDWHELAHFVDWSEEKFLANFTDLRSYQKAIHIRWSEEKPLPDDLEISYLIDRFVEWIKFIDNSSCDLKSGLEKIYFTVNVHHYFFLSQAKIRAFRIVMRKVLSELGLLGLEEKMVIMAQNCSYFYTLHDSWNNTLRATQAAMASLSADVHVMRLISHTEFLNKNSVKQDVKDDQFADSILQVVREESWIQKVKNPQNGSYYLDHLTLDVASSAWTYFQQLQEKREFQPKEVDAYIKTLQDRYLSELQVRVDNQELIISGVNRYIEKEDIHHRVDLDQLTDSFLTSKIEKTRVWAQSLKSKMKVFVSADSQLIRTESFKNFENYCLSLGIEFQLVKKVEDLIHLNDDDGLKMLINSTNESQQGKCGREFYFDQRGIIQLIKSEQKWNSNFQFFLYMLKDLQLPLQSWMNGHA